MTTAIIDSLYYGDLFACAPMKALFSDEKRFEAWLEVEAALARAQARLGLIPAEAAETITKAARIENIDQDAIMRTYAERGTRVVPLVKALVEAAGTDAGRYVHWGSTTQDIIDTGQVLQFRRAIDLLDPMLVRLEDVLIGLCRTHRTTVMAGRTNQQFAAPISFGHKAAVWLSELHRHRQRLSEIRPRLLVVQTSGAVGTNATLGDWGIEVRREVAKELALGAPTIGWHVSRDRWTELTALLGMIGATLAKIGQEVALLAHTEIAELAEPFEKGRGASSTLPQKRNPILCQPLIAAGRMLRERVALSLDAMVADHERPLGPGHLEFTLLPEAFSIAAGALQNALSLLDGLVVDAKRMRANLDMAGGLIMAEAVMMGLAPHIGRTDAHHVVYDACGRANDQGLTLKEALLAEPKVTETLSEAEIDAILDPANYLGVAPKMVDAVIAEVEAYRR